MRAMSLILVSAAVVACETDTDCDAMAAASVNITVTDLDGNPVAPTTLTYTVDGGEALSADCMNDACSDAVAGWEVAGEFVVTATLSDALEDDPCCWHDAEAVETVVIEQGECHVEGQQITLVLDTDQLICADADSNSECG